ncbi:ABC transporter ATP-binding protein [Halocatena marina]|uniref:ABC transporter ATP-binding protein n=1 Tax=Halocatena marina TaxID=2934937 RepID=UPI002225600E|nr:ABC transporter ATP-binding protein [Halocatena marina]
MSTQNAIEMVALTKRFGSVTAVDGVDLAVRSGSVFGLLGPNGAGKSTMIDLVLGLKTPTEGQVSVFGTNMTSDPRPARHRIGVLPEQYDVYDGMSGREHIRTFLRLKDADDDPERLCDAVGLSGKACDRPAGDYSKGMQQRLVLATALAGDPDLLILDEPTSGLDPEGIALVRECIRDRAADGTTIFFSSHRLAEVEAVCDRVGIVNDGRLVSIDDVDALADRSSGSERLRLFVDDAPAAELIERVRSVDDVRNVTEDGHTLSLDCTAPAAKADVIELVNHTCSVRDFELDGTDLETVFDATVEHDRSSDDMTGDATEAVE